MLSLSSLKLIGCRGAAARFFYARTVSLKCDSRHTSLSLCCGAVLGIALAS